MPAWHRADDACIREAASAWGEPPVTVALDEHRSRRATLAGHALRHGKAEACRRKCVTVARRP
jgi:hypothetical protein